MKFEKREIELDLYGEKFSLRYPTLRDAKKFKSDTEKVDEDRGIEMTIDFLDDLGLPKEKSEGMEIEHLDDLLSKLMPKDKKK